MPVTMKDVLAVLEPDEVDYGKAKKLGPEALPFLLELVKGGDPGLASKATYLASLIGTDHAMGVLEAAAASHEPVLRVAAASGIRNLPEVQAEKVLDLLRKDPDVGVRKVLLKSAGRLRSAEVEVKLQQMAETDPEPLLREMAAGAVNEMKKRRQAP